MCEESSMKKKVPGHGRNRDEEPAGRAGPRRICQSPSQLPFQLRSPFLYPPSEVRIWRFGQILTSLERFRVLIAKFGILSTQRIPGGDLVENHCFIEVKLANVCRFFGFWSGGDARENGDFQREKQRLQDTKIFYEDNFSEHCKCWWYRVALTRSKRSGRSIWKMKHVLNILAFNTCFNGSDVDENRHFIQGEVVAHRQILFLISIYE